MASLRRIEREFLNFNQNMPEIVHSIEKLNDDPMNWKIIMKGPDSSPYNEGFFSILVSFREDYPMRPPTFKIKTKVLHPNILPEGLLCRCCGQSSEKNWTPALTIQRAIYLIYDLFQYYDDQCDVAIENFRNFEEDKMRFFCIAREFTLKYAVENQDD